MSIENTENTGRAIDWRALVYKALGEDRTKPEDAYVFSNGRKFRNTDEMPGGPYAPQP